MLLQSILAHKHARMQARTGAHTHTTFDRVLLCQQDRPPTEAMSSRGVTNKENEQGIPRRDRSGADWLAALASWAGWLE